MGLFGTQWIQDMMDVSCGFGSWQLTMNAGLAHMQATSLINSCFSFSGFGFTPYSSMSSMDYLLNPNFAAWQASNGISSNSASIFGNWGGLSSGYTGGTTLSSWGNIGGNSGTTGSTGSKDKKETKENDDDPTNKNKATKLKKLLNDYAKELQKPEQSDGNQLIGKNIADNIDKFDKETKTWKDFYNKLDSIYQNILNGNDASLETFANLIQKDTNSKVIIGYKSDIIENWLKRSGYDNINYENTDYTNDARAIKDQILSFGPTNGNSDALDKLYAPDSSDLLGILSKYDGSIIDDFCNNYTKLPETMRSGPETSIKGVIGALIKRAEDILNELDKKGNIQDAISKLRPYSTGPFRSNGLKDAFEKLYAIVRVAETTVLEERIRAKYETIGGDKIAQKLDYVGKTKNDLKKELKKSDISSYVGTITAKKDESITNPLGGNGGVDNYGNDDEDMTPEEREAFRNKVEDNVKIHFKEQQNSYVTPEAVNTKLKLTKDKQYQVYIETHLGKTCYYVINDDGNMVVVEQKEGKYIPKDNTRPQSFDDVKYIIDSQVEADNEAKRAKEEADKVALRNNFKNPTSEAIKVIENHSVGNINRNHRNDIDTAIDNFMTENYVGNAEQYGYDPEDWECAIKTIKSYYTSAIRSILDNIDTTTYESNSHKGNPNSRSEFNPEFNYRVYKKGVQKGESASSSESSIIYKTAYGDDAKEFEKVQYEDYESSTGIWIGINHEKVYRDKLTIFIDTEVLFQKFKSFLP